VKWYLKYYYFYNILLFIRNRPKDLRNLLKAKLLRGRRGRGGRKIRSIKVRRRLVRRTRRRKHTGTKINQLLINSLNRFGYIDFLLFILFVIC
jgi:hypothetical protein